MRNSWGFNQIIYIYVCMDINRISWTKMVRNKTSSKHGYKSWALLGFLQEEMGFTLEVMDLYNLVDDLSMKIIQQIKSMVYVLVDDSCRKDMIIVSPENHLYRYYICRGDESNCRSKSRPAFFWFVPHKWQAFMDQNWHLCLPYGLVAMKSERRNSGCQISIFKQIHVYRSALVYLKGTGDFFGDAMEPLKHLWLLGQWCWSIWCAKDTYNIPQLLPLLLS